MPLTILIVNHHTDSSGNICRFLAAEGQKPISVAAETALQMAVELRPDVIVVELTTPEMNAIEVVNRLQKATETKHIPVIVLSNFPELEYELLHLFDFIGTPINLRRLREDINDISAGKKKRKLLPKQQLTPEEHHKFHDFLIRHSGLHFERRNIQMLIRGLDSRMTALQLTAYNDYYEYLRQNMERRNELQKLLQFLTVGETFFFRYQSHFKTLAKNTLATVLQSPAKKSVRIWSAGCSTGEEPYSIAMTIMEAIPDWKKRDIRILATDINSRSLKRAREGVFSAWKMRVTPTEYLEKYFTVIGESYLVKDDVKSLVDFSYCNLQAPPPVTCESFDVIFCRNVMIYFTTATTKKVVDMFAESLCPGGFLYLGHSETMVNVSSKFERLIHEGSFYYRKKSATAAEPEKPAVQAMPAAQARLGATGFSTSATATIVQPGQVKAVAGSNPDELFLRALTLLHQEHYSEAADVIRETLAVKPDHTGALLAAAQIWLAQGEKDTALDCCNSALALNDLLPGGYYLRGLLAEMADRFNDALQEYRKAILLKIDFVMPHYQSGKLCFRDGDIKTAARELRNSVKLLEKAGRGAVIPFSGGLTREVFLEQARAEMALVEAASAHQER